MTKYVVSINEYKNVSFLVWCKHNLEYILGSGHTLKTHGRKP